MHPKAHLISSTSVISISVNMNTPSNVRTLLLNSNQQVHGFVIKP